MDNRRARCRCTIVAYLEGSDKGQRAARDDDGKYQRIPADMSYRDWKAVYIDKTKTLETWRAEFDARRQADEQSPLRQRGRQVIEDLAAGRDPRAAPGGKVVMSNNGTIISRDVLPRGKSKMPDAEQENKFVPRTLIEAKSIANRLNPVVGKYFVRKSKWSGQVSITPNGNNCKLPNCDIGVLLKDCPDEAHELVHAHSTSYYSNEVYIANSAIEEASVQYLTQEIAKREGIILKGSDYNYWVDALRKINQKFGLYEADLKFAQRLLRVPMTHRLDWLSKKILKNRCS